MLGDIPVILQRAGEVNLKTNELCRRANVERSTVTRLKSGHSSANVSTLVRLSNAVVAEELRLLRHLRSLHGDAA